MASVVVVGSQWGDEALFEETGRILGWEEWSCIISGMHQNMQFMLNRDTFREEMPMVRTIQIRHKIGGYERFFDGITEFIRNTLRSQASYTLTPGRTPVNEDVVEYFLFESGQGYCQQFASAATLLYRLYGVPARYVSGYLLQPEDFEKQEDETWRAEVTDESAHAWSEVRWSKPLAER